mmetsp:Transcript_21358/g.59197  ORF Transcript_21358/g.59197 Transcript_21358/m.59197 type:complete len:82 (-) Transcript_21358:1200-1445(-)
MTTTQILWRQWSFRPRQPERHGKEMASNYNTTFSMSTGSSTSTSTSNVYRNSFVKITTTTTRKPAACHGSINWGNNVLLSV